MVIRTTLFRCVFLCSLVFLPGCGIYSFSLDTVNRLTPEYPYPPIDKKFGEKLQKNEHIYAENIASVIKKGILDQFETDKNARRDVHPKAHGCVKAKFTVVDKLSDNLAKGIFIPNKSYDAIIRFSNSDADPNLPDYEGDARGMAIKLKGVFGKKLLEADTDSMEHDFLLVNHPVFPLDDVSDYLLLTNIIHSDAFLVKTFRPILLAWALGLKGTLISLDSTSKIIDNPLNTQYWSMVPYQLGIGVNRKAVKYSTRARSCDPKENSKPFYKPDYSRKDFLRETMTKTLAQGSRCMDFLIQVRDPNTMSVEVSQNEWLESKSEFKKVAIIEIAQQEFNTDKMNDSCEKLSFNPWRVLSEHRPLGAINRARKLVYSIVSQTRLNSNSVNLP